MSYQGGRWRICVSWLSYTSTNTTFLFQSQRLLFSHTSAEVRGKNTLERKFASTRDRIHNQQVMSPTSDHWATLAGLGCLGIKRRQCLRWRDKLSTWTYADCIGCNTAFNIILDISRRPLHLSILSCSSFNQYSAQYSFQTTGCFPT